MKFETYNHKIVKNYQKEFSKDPCTHAHTRGVNQRARVLSRVRILLPRLRACVHRTLQKSVDNSSLSYEYKSQIS